MIYWNISSIVDYDDLGIQVAEGSYLKANQSSITIFDSTNSKICSRALGLPM